MHLFKIFITNTNTITIILYIQRLRILNSSASLVVREVYAFPGRCTNVEYLADASSKKRTRDSNSLLFNDRR